MHRDIDPREFDRDRPDMPRGGRGSGEPGRTPVVDDPRDALTRDLDLPRGPSRDRVRVRNWEGDLRGSEVRVLAAAGAFRVVPIDELRRPDDRPHVHRKDVERLRSLDLVRTMPYVVGRERTTLVTLTDRGREVLEAARREHGTEPHQAYYAGVAKPRELAHDARVHRAYLEVRRRLDERGLQVRRVVLEQELKREYQTFLQEPNRGRRTSSGRPQRDAIEIARWAREHQLPVVDEHVQFPDLRLECEGRDGQRHIEDVEVMTPHYRGAHAAAKVRAGFTRYGAVGARVGGASGSRRSGRGLESRLAEEMLP
jgi:hypothetical protein